MKTYVAGPITGIPNGNRSKFEAAAKRLRALGHEVIIPHEIPPVTDDWHTALRADIVVLMTCEKVYLLEGWRNSRGARLEAYIAQCLEMEIEEEIDLEEVPVAAI